MRGGLLSPGYGGPELNLSHLFIHDSGYIDTRICALRLGDLALLCITFLQYQSHTLENGNNEFSEMIIWNVFGSLSGGLPFKLAVSNCQCHCGQQGVTRLAQNLTDKRPTSWIQAFRQQQRTMSTLN